MHTPVQPFTGLVPPEYKDPDYQAGVVCRIEAEIGRRPGRLGPQDEGAGLAKDFYELRDALGRMPGRLGVDDEGKGLFRHVFDQQRAVKKNGHRSTGALAGAAAAVLLAVATLVSGYARATYPAPAPVQVQVSSPPAASAR